MQIVRKCFIPYILSNKVRKNQLCYVALPTKSAQAISSIFSPNTKLGSNFEQSTTKMAVVPLRCNSSRSKVFHTIDTIILDQEKDSFAPLYHQPSRHRP